MVAMLVKPLPAYLDMPVLQLDNIALSGETLATIAEAETAIALIRTARIDATGLEWRLTASVSCNPDGYRVRPDPRIPPIAAKDEYALRPDAARRPQVEPATARLMAIARHRPLTTAHLINALASLTGAPSCWRTTGHSLFPDASGLVVRFPSHEQIQGGLRQILRFANDRKCVLPPLAQAGASVAALLALHPVADGNGRLSRALAQAVLARRDILDRPLLPLGPVLRANARHYAGAMRLFATAADWDLYISLFARAALRTAHAVLALAKATR